MPLDIGRVTHLQDLMHRAESSNGTAITSNWVVSTDGSKAVTWRPESASALSYASNSNDVASGNAPGASSLVSRADHVHRGVRTVTSNTSNSLFGDVNVAAGTGIAIAVSGQTVTLTNTGVPGPAGSGASYGSNSNDVSYVDAPGASPLVSRADHVHLGVTSLSHSSNTYTGPVTLETEGSLYIVRSAANTYRLGASSGSGGGSGSTDAILGQSGIGGARIPGLQGSPDIRVAGTNDDEFDTTDTTDPMTGWTTLGTPTSHDINSTAKSHYYVTKAAAAAVNWAGIYKAPPAAPFTVTAKLSDLRGSAAFNSACLFVGPTTPGAMDAIAYGAPDAAGPGRIALVNYTNPTTFNATIVAAVVTGGPPVYLRIVVTTTTNVAYYYSLGGLSFHPITTGRNPSITINAAGIAAQSNHATIAGEAFFDWIRFT